MNRFSLRPGPFRRFRKDENGSSTIEFALFVPFFLMLFLSCFELGMLMARNVMLDRGVDISVRALRLGTINPLNEATLKEAICDAAVIIPDCENQLRLEMRQLDPRNWSQIPNDADCVDRGDPGLPAREFAPTNNSNQMVILRACVLADPISPLVGFGAVLSNNGSDAYELVATTAYVVEP